MDMDSNVAYSMTPLNTKSATSDHEYDIIKNPHTAVTTNSPTPIVPPRSPLSGKEPCEYEVPGANYEVNTPPNIRAMRAREQGDEELYTQIPKST